MLLLTSKSLEKEEEIQSQWRAQWLAYDSDLVIPSSYRHRRCGGLFGVSKWLACVLSLPPRADGCAESKVIGGAADSDLMLHSVTRVGRHYIFEVKMVMIYRHPYRCSTAICSVVLHFAVPFYYSLSKVVERAAHSSALKVCSHSLAILRRGYGAIFLLRLEARRHLPERASRAHVSRVFVLLNNSTPIGLKSVMSFTGSTSRQRQ